MAAQPRKADPAVVEAKLAKLTPKLAELEAQLEATTDSRKRQKLISKIVTVEEKIKQVKTGERMTRQQKRDLIAYSFIAPNFIGFAVFTLGPVIFAFVLAFLKWDGNSPIEFAALDNFMAMIGNTRFIAAFKNTIVYCIATVPLTLVAAIGLAVALNQNIKGRNFFPYRQFLPIRCILSSGSGSMEYAVFPCKERSGQYAAVQSIPCSG